jgi:hypothetical protein
MDFTQPMTQTTTVPYLVTAFLIYFVQKWMKTHPTYAKLVEALPGADKWAHRAIASIGSLLFALGIHFTIEGDAGHGWRILTSIPPLHEMIDVILDWSNVFILQQGVYEIAKPKQWTPPAVNIEPPKLMLDK